MKAKCYKFIGSYGGGICLVKKSESSSYYDNNSNWKYVGLIDLDEETFEEINNEWYQE